MVLNSAKTTYAYRPREIFVLNSNRMKFGSVDKLNMSLIAYSPIEK